MQNFHDLERSRYALLRSYRRDGTAVDTPIWFAFPSDGDRTGLVFRTKIGPKTRRLVNDPRVTLLPCDHRGTVTPSTPAALGDEAARYEPGRRASAMSPVFGHATVLSGSVAAEGNTALRRRYGWQYNVVPLLTIPGVTNVHSKLPWREKWRRVWDRGIWPDSVIVRIELATRPDSPDPGVPSDHPSVPTTG